MTKVKIYICAKEFIFNWNCYEKIRYNSFNYSFNYIFNLAKVKFCNILGHFISKSVWIDLSNFDIIDQFSWICKNLSHYYNRC